MSTDLSDPVVQAITHARVKLLFSKPFFGQLSTRLELVDASDWCQTAATDGRNLFYNRDFIKALSPNELLFLIGHEVLHCFPAGTVIPGSWKNIEDVQVGDDLIGENGLWTKAVKPMVGRFVGKMITIKPRGMLSQQMTSEHPVLTRQASWKTSGPRNQRRNVREFTEPKWTNAEDVKAGDWVQIPRSKGIHTDVILQFECTANAWSSPQKIRDGVKLDEAVAEFLGWYVAEGSTTITTNNDFVSAISFNANERIAAEKLQACLADRFGVSSSIQPHGENGIVLQFSSAPLGRWLNANCGHLAKNKKIPEIVLENTDEGILKSFISAYLTGDGHVGEAVNFGTVSRVLAYQMQYAAARLGFIFNLHERAAYTGEIRGVEINCAPLFLGNTRHTLAFQIVDPNHTPPGRSTQYLHVEDGAIWTPVKSTRSEDYDGPVYNIETESHTYAAANIMTHNCVYDHLGRRSSRDPKLWNMANDYIVNDTLTKESVGSMPTGGLLDPNYHDDMSSEEVYDLLVKNSAKIKMTLDHHLEHKDSTDENGDGQEVEVTIMGGSNGPPKLTEEDLENLRNEIRADLIRTVQSVGAGKTPAGILRLIDDLLEPKMDWRTLLDAHIRSSLRDDYTFQRIGRRTWGTSKLGRGRPFVLPGQNFMDTIDIAIAIDASGSLSGPMLRDFISEVKGIMETFRDFKIKLWSFDTQVYNFKEFTMENLDEIMDWSPGGGGGTLFECNWEFMKREGIEPARFVMFTDGYPNSTWGDPDYCDTLFVVHGAPHITAPWGITAHYEPKE